MKRRRHPELRHLRYFVAAAEHGSFRKAGVALGIQESAVSRRIRDLEDELGASLFQRQTTGVVLTVAGQRFLSSARRALQSVSDGATDVAAIGRCEEGKIRIGVFSSLASGFLRSLLDSYDRAHGGVAIELINGNPAEYVNSVRQLQLDIAFITGTTSWRGCDTAHLWSERVYLALQRQHALARSDEIDWSSVANERFILSKAAPGPEVHDYLMQRLLALGHHPEIEAQSVGRDNLMTLVAIGRGMTVTTEAATAACFPGVVYRPIRGEELSFSAVWSPRNDNPACRRMISMARQLAQAQRTSETSLAGTSSTMRAAPSQSHDPSR